MEASWVVGPAKNLLEFAGRARQPEEGRRTVELSIITFVRGNGDNAFIDAARKLGIEITAIHERRRFDTGVFDVLKKTIAKTGPDILQSHNVKSHFFVRLLGLHRSLPWVAFNHGYTATDFKDKLYNQFDRWSLRGARLVIAVCRPFALRLERYGVDPARIRIQHNSVRAFSPQPPDAACELRRAMGLEGCAVALAVGRLSYEKGHRDLLESVRLLKTAKKFADLPPYRFVIVGDGPERAALTRSAGDLGVSEEVIFAGHQSDVRPYYQMADLLVLPSHTEGSPNVVLEAMAAGLPVAATEVGGVPEIVEPDGSGLIFPPRRPDKMAEAIVTLLRDPVRRKQLGERGSEIARTRFSPEQYCRSLIQFYEQALLFN